MSVEIQPTPATPPVPEQPTAGETGDRLALKLFLAGFALLVLLLLAEAISFLLR